MSFLKHYGVDLIITVLVGVAIGIFMSPLAVIPFIILVILEVSFSFDNAVVNSTVLEQMNRRWQRLFLFIGLPIAVLGMRFVFPIAIVALTSKINFGDVVNLAFANPASYSEKLTSAHPLISMFGGVYLLLIFLDFIFEDRDIKWIQFLEKPLAKVGKLDNLSLMLAGVFVLVASLTFGQANMTSLLIAGFGSILLYMAVNAISSVFESEDDDSVKKPIRHGFAALGLFIYLEVQDSAFSFDGVSAAFAITNSVVLIAAGLGIGALFVRSMTIHLVRTGAIGEYRYLDHGAHWAIGVLSVFMLLGVAGIDVSDFIVGLIGVVFVGVAFLHSKRENKKDEALALLSSPSLQEAPQQKITV